MSGDWIDVVGEHVIEGRVMRAVFVLTTVVLAIALGIIAGASESRFLTRALVAGFVPTIWVASQVIERLTGRDLWHFKAPYPYRWMAGHRESTRPLADVAPQPVDEVLQTGEPLSRLPRAA
ncbi:MAG TPA: hypothetical protein VH417_07035 [Vicinamibacterales bacterium]